MRNEVGEKRKIYFKKIIIWKLFLPQNKITRNYNKIENIKKRTNMILF